MISTLGQLLNLGLCIEINAWQSDNAPIITHILVPYRCEERIQHGQPLTDVETADLFELLKACNVGAEEDEDEDDEKSTCLFAAVGTLVALGENWLGQNLEAQQQVFEVLRTGIEAVDHMGSSRDELKFIAYAVMHLWLTDKGNVEEWEVAVLRLLSSGDMKATEIVIGVAYANREQLGPTWWRLLRAGLFWAGLTLLTPRHSDDDNTERAWKAWLERLRRFPLRGQNATPDDLDFKRIAVGQERLDFLRRTRRYNRHNQIRQRKPEREMIGFLHSRLLQVLFNWLIEGEGTGNRCLDTSLTLRIWNYDIARAKARKKNEDGEYGLPSDDYGYEVLLKLAELTVAAPDKEQRGVWEPILSHGPAAHYALQHFIRGLFLRLAKGDEPAAFECVWREVTEYGLASNWSETRLWFYGESLICDLLGFGNEDALSRLESGAALRMKDVYERWATNHLDREKCVTRFCHFLKTDFGAPLRPDGLCWLADMLKKCEPSNYWYRERTGEALIVLVTKVLNCDAQILSQDARARQALVEIAAALAAKNIPGALSLQERIKLLR